VKKYSGIKQIIENKEEHRRRLAALPFEEKVAMVFKLSVRKKFIKSGLVVNRAQRPKAKL
jgi:hypothetical protein